MFTVELVENPQTVELQGEGGSWGFLGGRCPGTLRKLREVKE